METSYSVIKEVVFSEVKALNRQLPTGGKLAEEPETVIFGRGGTIDSLSLVSLLANIEEALAARLGLQCNLIDGMAWAEMSERSYTVKELVDLIVATSK